MLNIENKYNFEEIRSRLMQGPRITTLLDAFEKIASGIAQRPRTTIVAQESFLECNMDLAKFHSILQENLGIFLNHGFASIPFLLEEVIRMGVAINRLASWKLSQNQRQFNYYETSSADGTVARTLAKFAEGNIFTLTDSPNEANFQEFRRLCKHNFSTFHLGPFSDITPSYLEQKYPHLATKFDFIWENTTFQMYGNFRNEQIAYLKQVLRPDGIIVFFEKMNHKDKVEYQYRETIKDENFKSKYFSEKDISDKKQHIISTMELGQTTLEDFSHNLAKHFRHAYLIWNSANFYQIAASNNKLNLDYFVMNLEVPFIPSPFNFEKPRKLF